ncbi:AAA family ATPase [Altericroceibacterium xinjiangense]|uniref:AAA family ATPase n=1 Tax=Altericroceibacterium xinjiangense TaxID=762261 RepID=UPI000F7E0C80|nr:AAA family ATPase [Altericroceibacterium xinjiangense]
MPLSLADAERDDLPPFAPADAYAEGGAPSREDKRAARERPLLPFEWAGDVQPVLDGVWLIDDFLPKSGAGVLYGHPGSGKTFLALHMAAHVAEGREWAGRHVERGMVLYLAAEGQSGFRNRLSAMIDEGVLSRTAPFAFVPAPIDLQAPKGTDVDRLISTIRHVAERTCAPALIVIDTLSKTFGAGKENTDDMGHYVANCERIASEFNCLALIVHHRPRNGEGQSERGHSSLRGGIVTSILVEGDDIKTATTVKQKEGEEGEQVSFRLDPITLGTNARGKEITSCLVEIVEHEAAPKPSAAESKKRSLKGHNKIAFEAIETLIALHGKEPPDSLPREVIDRSKIWRVINGGQVADKLKSEFLSVVKAQPDKVADTAERTARRAMTALKAAGLLGSWEEWVWLA